MLLSDSLLMVLELISVLIPNFSCFLFYWNLLDVFFFPLFLLREWNSQLYSKFDGFCAHVTREDDSVVRALLQTTPDLNMMVGTGRFHKPVMCIILYLTE